MVYEFDKKVINTNGIKDFYKKGVFVGYILPDGSIYECVNHNVETVESIIKMGIQLLKTDFNSRDLFLDYNTNDKMVKYVVNYFKRISYDEVIALDNFIERNHLFVSDLLVQLFGFNLITRRNKRIITANEDHSVFYNYLLNDYVIETIDRIVYNRGKKEFEFVSHMDKNHRLYDEIEQIKRDANGQNMDLFYRKK